MEEKERYVIRYDLDYNRCLIDTEKNQGVGDYIQIVKLLNQQDKRIKDLQQQLAITEKALELACDLIKSIAIVAQSYGLEEPNCNVKDAEYFKQQAKEMLENE